MSTPEKNTSLKTPRTVSVEDGNQALGKETATVKIIAAHEISTSGLPDTHVIVSRIKTARKIVELYSSAM